MPKRYKLRWTFDSPNDPNGEQHEMSFERFLESKIRQYIFLADQGEREPLDRILKHFADLEQKDLASKHREPHPRRLPKGDKLLAEESKLLELGTPKNKVAAVIGYKFSVDVRYVRRELRRAKGPK